MHLQPSGSPRLGIAGVVLEAGLVRGDFVPLVDPIQRGSRFPREVVLIVMTVKAQEDKWKYLEPLKA